MPYNKPMKRLSVMISDIYNKYLPFSKSQRIAFDLNVSEFDGDIVDIDEIESHLDEQLQNLLKESREHGAISLGIENGYIVIRDSETILSPLVCQALSKGRVEVKSRVGFGTTIYISTESKKSKTHEDMISTSNESKTSITDHGVKELKSSSVESRSKESK